LETTIFVRGRKGGASDPPRRSRKKRRSEGNLGHKSGGTQNSWPKEGIGKKLQEGKAGGGHKTTGARIEGIQGKISTAL